VIWLQHIYLHSD